MAREAIPRGVSADSDDAGDGRTIGHDGPAAPAAVGIEAAAQASAVPAEPRRFGKNEYGRSRQLPE